MLIPSSIAHPQISNLVVLYMYFYMYFKGFKSGLFFKVKLFKVFPGLPGDIVKGLTNMVFFFMKDYQACLEILDPSLQTLALPWQKGEKGNPGPELEGEPGRNGLAGERGRSLTH